MAETNFTLHSTDTNNYSVQKTFSGVNPEASSAELVETAKGFNRLTDNTYVGTKRINKFDCDNEDGGTAKATPTLTITSSGYFTADGYRHFDNFTYTGNGTLTVSAKSADGYFYGGTIREENGQLSAVVPNGVNGTEYTVTIHATETDEYTSATITNTFTWSQS